MKNFELSDEELNLLSKAIRAHINQCERLLSSFEDDFDVSSVKTKIDKLNKLREKLS